MRSHLIAFCLFTIKFIEHGDMLSVLINVVTLFIAESVKFQIPFVGQNSMSTIHTTSRSQIAFTLVTEKSNEK